MSYDLNFWKQTKGFTLEPQAVYERLCEQERVDGLEDLPIKDMVEKVAEAFADWERLDDETWESDKGAFQLTTTPQSLRVDCSGMEGEDMNKFIDVAAAFQCPLYDPQVGQRFEG